MTAESFIHFTSHSSHFSSSYFKPTIAMRLLHIDTLELYEFFGSEIPPYAILSHRWEGDEISFKEVRKSRNLNSRGWAKIKDFASFVKKHDVSNGPLKWIWIDTCCIDKQSSAELSEAINSMYQWYKRAKICYAYLNDVSCGGLAVRLKLKDSKWFTRGWTLQELIAPSRVCFVDKNWTTVLGDKDSLAATLSEITGITDFTLARCEFTSQGCSVAQRMSWAAGRICTREEDRAYSLMGLFSVSMPLLYGEGGRSAFLRLQEEILKTSNDETIFAWSPKERDKRSKIWGMLAESPEYFDASAGYLRHRYYTDRCEYAMTNIGLKFEAILGELVDAKHLRHMVTDSVDFYKVRPFALNCYDRSRSGCLIVFLRRSLENERCYHRIFPLEAMKSQLLLSIVDSSGIPFAGTSGDRQIFYVGAYK